MRMPAAFTVAGVLCMAFAMLSLAPAREVAAGTCEAAGEESIRATVEFLNVVAGVKEATRCTEADKAQLYRVLAAAEKAKFAMLSANKACGLSPLTDGDSRVTRLFDLVKKRIAECNAADDGAN
jgi:hypothetical protein